MIKLIKILLVLVLFDIGLSQVDDNEKINTVNFIGVGSFSDQQIRDVLRIHESSLFTKMNYDRRLIKLDAINIKTYYVSKGFLGVNVKDSVRILKSLVDVYFIVDEGKKYYINSIAVSGNESISSSAISKLLGIRLYKPFNPVKTNANFNLLEDKYRRIGKLFANINISDVIDDSVAINIAIDEGPDVYINNTYL